ncbi:Fic family protein [Clostridium ljungdahlii]|uniref:Adenosine monophosphate-protein transferase and cysteine protease IbpA n=1 Tax=Clostridium ljungdahlii TaxID=1538 RepID=A0A168PID8_9CLOT|nr:Fic family protein [Clostridium ljungdahlii]OAA87784.1 Adenosine monophosphate-protein transferase and cysteine protease IbpA precursor [Clostridium ljungdahlii]
MFYNEAIKVWRKGKTKTMLNRFFVKFTYSSNKIANNETRLRDVETVFKGEKVTTFEVNKKTIKEIENHRDFCNNILHLAEENNRKLSIELIKNVHYSLMKDCFTEELLYKGEKPGEFKKDDYIVNLTNADVSSLKIEKNLNLLIRAINDVDINKSNVLKIVGYFICSFQVIHPFANGNGRVGRVLLNYLLIGNNLPPIIIFEIDKEEYYLALEYFNNRKNISKMVDFLDEQAYKTWVKNYNIKKKNLKDFLDN